MPTDPQTDSFQPRPTDRVAMAIEQCSCEGPPVWMLSRTLGRVCFRCQKPISPATSSTDVVVFKTAMFRLEKAVIAWVDERHSSHDHVSAELNAARQALLDLYAGEQIAANGESEDSQILDEIEASDGWEISQHLSNHTGVVHWRHGTKRGRLRDLVRAALRADGGEKVASGSTAPSDAAMTGNEPAGQVVTVPPSPSDLVAELEQFGTAPHMYKDVAALCLRAAAELRRLEVREKQNLEIADAAIWDAKRQSERAAEAEKLAKAWQDMQHEAALEAIRYSADAEEARAEIDRLTAQLAALKAEGIEGVVEDGAIAYDDPVNKQGAYPAPTMMVVPVPADWPVTTRVVVRRVEGVDAAPRAVRRTKEEK